MGLSPPTPRATGAVKVAVKIARSHYHGNMSLPDVHANVESVAFLLGAWAGVGRGEYPTIESFSYNETITFSHVGKPFLSYTQRTTDAADGRPLHAETGYLRVPSPGRVEFVVAHPTGIVEVYEGTLEVSDSTATILIATTSIARTETAKQVSEMQRTFSVDLRPDRMSLSYSVAMSAMGLALTHHLAAELTKQP
jgi:hypothetical protein